MKVTMHPIRDVKPEDFVARDLEMGVLKTIDSIEKETCVKELKNSDLFENQCGIAAREGRSDNANATAFIQSTGHVLRYVPTWKKWLVWDGKRWRVDDDSSAVTHRARRYASSLWTELGNIRCEPKEFHTIAGFVRTTNQSHGIEGFLKLARCDETVVISHEQLNAFPMRLNVLNGTIDLESGKLNQHNPEDHITQLANVEFDSKAEAPEWMKTLELIFDNDSELIRYCQQFRSCVVERTFPSLSRLGRTADANQICHRYGTSFQA